MDFGNVLILSQEIYPAYYIDVNDLSSVFSIETRSQYLYSPFCSNGLSYPIIKLES